MLSMFLIKCNEIYLYPYKSSANIAFIKIFKKTKSYSISGLINVNQEVDQQNVCLDSSHIYLYNFYLKCSVLSRDMYIDLCISYSTMHNRVNE